MEFSARERGIFKAVCSALVGEETDDSVADAISPFLRALPPFDRTSLGFLLRIVENLAPSLSGRFGRFSTLELAEREAILRSWSTSRLAIVRQAAASLKVLSMLGFYGRESEWGAVGYNGPWLGRVQVPVLPAPDLHAGSVGAVTIRGAGPARPGHAPALKAGITVGREVKRDLRIKVQACVIGTGAGGAAALARLAEHGIDAVGVEAGGYHQAEVFTQRELEMLPLLYQEAGLRSTADKAIGILQGTGVGGSTLHNTGLVYPTPTGITDRWRAEHGFQIEEAEFAAYIAEAVEVLQAVPIPPDRINANNEALRRGSEALGWRYRIALHNRVECSGCGYCMLGCAYNRKSNATLTWVPRAIAAGARVLADAKAEKIEGGPGARRVVCQLHDARGKPTGRQAIIEADVVVIAAGALDTPALLQRSGMGNRRVGRGLRLHPSPVVSAIFPEEIRAWRGLPQSVLVEEFATFLNNGRGGFLLVPTASNWPALSAAVTPGIGREHRGRMRHLPRIASAAVLLHDETEGTVSAARSGGRPVAHYWPNRDDMDELRKGVRSAALAYFAAGAEKVQLPFADLPLVENERALESALQHGRALPHLFSLNAVHPQGSCPLGVDRARSATDPHGEVWGEPGIFISDSSLFPTSVGVPPQITTMALAAAVADRVVEKIGSRDGHL